MAELTAHKGVFFMFAYLSTENTLAILPMARILLRMTSLRAEAVAPGRGQRSDAVMQTVSHAY